LLYDTSETFEAVMDGSAVVMSSMNQPIQDHGHSFEPSVSQNPPVTTEMEFARRMIQQLDRTGHTPSTVMAEAAGLFSEWYISDSRNQLETSTGTKTPESGHGFIQIWDDGAHSPNLAKEYQVLQWECTKQEASDTVLQEYLQETACLIAANERMAEEEQETRLEQWQREWLEERRIEEAMSLLEDMELNAGEATLSNECEETDLVAAAYKNRKPEQTPLIREPADEAMPAHVEWSVSCPSSL